MSAGLSFLFPGSAASQYKIVRNFVFSEEDMIKTTTLKIKRPKEQEHIEGRLAECGRTMYEMNGKNFDKMIKA